MLPQTRPMLRAAVVALLALALLLPGVGEAHAPAWRAVESRPAAQRTARQALADLSLPQRVGQLFMVGTPADRVDERTRAQIRRYHVGNVMLTGRSHGGTRPPRRVSRAMRHQVSPGSTGRVRLLVATDQEGGLVQVLQGSGFDDLPTALVQGTWSRARLRHAAAAWARQLRRAGVNMNLAPVADTVPGRRAAQHNPPIGRYDREFGFTPTRVARHAVAFLRGMGDGAVVPTVKHFPGLGRVHANTDTDAHVTDRVTRRHDPYLAPFRAAIHADVPAVMMSTAYYRRLDPRWPAAFSPFVVGTVLRRDLGYDGMVVSDDLARAAQVASFSPAGRALRFIGAGGDLLLSVDPEPVPAMYAAVLKRARHRPAFRAKVDAAALRVLRAKARQGLLGRVR